MNREQLNEVIEKHKSWLKDNNEEEAMFEWMVRYLAEATKVDKFAMECLNFLTDCDDPSECNGNLTESKNGLCFACENSYRLRGRE